ncbi:MAG: biotin/lipoyl-containing protein, partial [Microbacterium sp.]
AVTRARIGAAACAAAASVDYRGAGTVEFLVAGDRPDEFFFIEMNTRLQVEHPVTELVTGIDLVEQQLRIAAGDPLAFSQEEVRLEGHAIEARVYAESPERGFLPATGAVLLWQPAEGVRTDAAVETGSVVTSDYDPMIAKVIAHGADRAEALARLDAALADTVLLGVEANIGFLRELLADDGVQDGRMDTGLIDRMPPFTAPQPTSLALGAAAADGAASDARERVDASSPLWRERSGWRAGGPPPAPTVAIETADGIVVVPMPAPRVFAGATPEDAWRIDRPDDDGVTLAVDADGWTWVHADGATHRLRPLSRRQAMESRLAARERSAAETDPELRAPMPGAVVAVHAADGAAVASGDRLVTIEAMKMEHPVLAPHAGVVRLDVAVGDQVRRDQILAHVTLTPAVHETADSPS